MSSDMLKMEIKNTKRILAVSPPDSGLLDLLKGLTGSTPPQTGDTIAGLSHDWSITTTYYTAAIPIWLDIISSPSSWSSDFLQPEAKEVLAALGAFVVCFRKPVNQEGMEEVKKLLEAVGEVVREGCGFVWDGVFVAVAMPQSIKPALEVGVEEWEEICGECGVEFVDWEGVGRNEFGEPMGVARLKEALEANDWAMNDDDDGGIDFDELLDDDGEGSTGIGMEAAQLEMEIFGMKQAIYGEDEDSEKEKGGEGEEEEEDSVEKLEAMMLRMQAVKDMGADLPEAERKKFAAKAVNDIMKTL